MTVDLLGTRCTKHRCRHAFRGHGDEESDVLVGRSMCLWEDRSARERFGEAANVWGRRWKFGVPPIARCLAQKCSGTFTLENHRGRRCVGEYDKSRGSLSCNGGQKSTTDKDNCCLWPGTIYSPHAPPPYLDLSAKLVPI